MKKLQHRIFSLLVIGEVWGALASTCLPSMGAGIGSPLIHRQHTDIDLGQVYVYDGHPFRSAGKVSSWAFFDDRNAGLSVTPLLFKINGSNVFTLVGMGRTRMSAGTGLQNFSFEPTAGSGDVTPEKYTFGFANRAYSLNGTALVEGPSNRGVISFDRPSATIPCNPWRVTAAVSSGGAVALQIGTIIGSGGVPIYNSIDPGGFDRVYSAQASLVSPPKPILSPQLVGGSFRFSLQTAVGQTYTVLENADLATANWGAYTNLVGDGSLMQFTVPVGTFSQRFFRVE